MKKILHLFLLLSLLSSSALAGDDRMLIYNKATGRSKILGPADSSKCLNDTGGGTIQWGACGGGGVGGSGVSTLQVDDVTVSSSIDTLDFSTGFDVTESPAGEANITFDFTEFNSLTFGDSSLATYNWDFALSGATDPRFTFANNLVTVSTPLTAGGTASRVTGTNSTYLDFATSSTIIFGGGNQIRIPAVAAPAQTVNADVSWDSDDFRLFIADGTRAVSAGNKIKTRSFVIGSPATGSDFTFWQTKYAITITAVYAISSGGTNVIGQLQEYDGTAGSPVDVDSADWTVTTSEYSDTSFSNPSIDAGDYIGWKTTSVSGTVNFLTVTFEYYET